MCSVILKVKYLAGYDKDQLIEVEDMSSTEERIATLTKAGHVEKISIFYLKESLVRTVDYVRTPISEEGNQANVIEDQVNNTNESPQHETVQ